ncbi:MAG: hypothetical protein LBL18_06185 [Bacteroidales bacterium]|jgi:hypothetical protein|nr:hypothetical protein [Bacteroidales bacterium]
MEKYLNIIQRIYHAEMKKIILVMLYVFASYAMYSQNGFQISGGYIPSQELLINDDSRQDVSAGKNSNAITFDISGWIFSDLENPFTLGVGYGLGIRSYRKIPKEALLNTDDPYAESATRFDIHAGPAVGFGAADYAYLVLSPQFGLWYAGMSNAGPKVNFIAALTADLIIGRVVSLGITYRATSPRLVSTDWNIYNIRNSYILIKPALEFRLSLFILQD